VNSTVRDIKPPINPFTKACCGSCSRSVPMFVPDGAPASEWRRYQESIYCRDREEVILGKDSYECYCSES